MAGIENKPDPSKMAKISYSSDMRSQTLENRLSFPKDLRDDIEIECLRLIDRESQPRDVVQLLTQSQYPSYDEAITRLGTEKMMKAEYGESNHKWLNRMCNDIQDIDNIKAVGRLIEKG